MTNNEELGVVTARGAAKRVYVLDTNVLIHDPTSLFRFAEHDVCLPVTVIEELDNNKKGQSEVARNARQATRLIYKVISGARAESGTKGIVAYPLAPVDRKARGSLLLQTERFELANMPQGFDPTKPDNHILQTAFFFTQTGGGADVILVTKDVNVAIKAKLYGITTQDYENDKVLDDADVLPSGIRKLPKNFWERLPDLKAEHSSEGAIYRIAAAHLPRMLRTVCLNEFVYWDDGKKPFLSRVIAHDDEGVTLRTIKPYDTDRSAVYGIAARNAEQSFALGLLLDPEIDFVTLLGQAGTGKTLLALAAGLTQVIDDKLYNEIIFTRATVPLGNDIGFLPGTEEEKMNPWMGALEDNLEVLSGNAEDSGPEKGNLSGKTEMRRQINRYIKVKSMNFMRGRTFLRKYLVIDEAQNLTSKQMKAIVTRAGPGTKVVCLGNIGQIDTPYLTEGSSGLSYAVERFRSGDPTLPFGWPNYGHIILSQAVRSRLATHAEKVFK